MTTNRRTWRQSIVGTFVWSGRCSIDAALSRLRGEAFGLIASRIPSRCTGVLRALGGRGVTRATVTASNYKRQILMRYVISSLGCSPMSRAVGRRPTGDIGVRAMAFRTDRRFFIHAGVAKACFGSPSGSRSSSNVWTMSIGVTCDLRVGVTNTSSSIGPTRGDATSAPHASGTLSTLSMTLAVAAAARETGGITLSSTGCITFKDRDARCGGRRLIVGPTTSLGNRIQQVAGFERVKVELGTSRIPMLHRAAIPGFSKKKKKKMKKKKTNKKTNKKTIRIFVSYETLDHGMYIHVL